MSGTPVDVIDHLVGIETGSRLDAVRTARPQARANAQASFEALFRPRDAGDVSLEERCALALFVAGLHRADQEASFYSGELAAVLTRPGLIEAVRTESQLGEAEGPTGHYPDGPLRTEGTETRAYGIAPDRRAALGPRLAAAFEHAHMLVFHPREASPDALQSLLDAGWTTTGIVTLSQIVSFLAFQIRVVSGLRVLAAAAGTAPPRSSVGSQA